MQQELPASVRSNLGGIELLYRICAFLSAFVLFALEPLIVKMALPLYGGSAAVWSAAYLFFTVALLCGYLYAHALARRPLMQQCMIHGALFLVAVLDLPIRLQPRAVCSECSPSVSLLMLLAERVGLPFLVLSATSPLLQSWWARRGQDAGEPYSLFAFSNLGSIAALLAYPFAIEPFLGLSLQTFLWAGGYVAIVLVLFVIGVRLILQARTKERTGESTAAPSSGQSRANQLAVHPPQSSQKTRAKKGHASHTDRKAPSSDQPVGSRSRVKVRVEWTFIAALQVLLLLALTNHLSTEIAPIPFVWTLPLTLYLLAFVIVFARLQRLRASGIVSVLPVALLPVVVLLALHEKVALVPYVVLQLSAFFLLVTGLTVRLASLRPVVTELTQFYLWIAVGGALGGIAVVFLAPHFFTTVAEYPIAIVLACLLLPSSAAGSEGWRRPVFDVVIGGLFTLGVLSMMRWAPLEGASVAATQRLWLTVAAGLAILFFSRRLRFATAIAMLLSVGSILPSENGKPLLLERNFFGPKQVVVDSQRRFHFLLSGGTVHGVQLLVPGSEREPAAYYSKSGPLGDIFQAGGVRFANREIGVVGMGIGAAGCYGEPGQHWTFYELDPAVVAIARDPDVFSVLDACAPDAAVFVGDGRLKLAADPPRRYALLILDAYSGDQVPVHLLTREALALYLARTADDGILAFHISNRHFDLAPVLNGLAADAKLSILERDDLGLSPEDVKSGKMVSRWVVMARQGQLPAALNNDPRWHLPAQDPGLPLWTDNYSSLARVLHF